MRAAIVTQAAYKESPQLADVLISEPSSEKEIAHTNLSKQITLNNKDVKHSAPTLTLFSVASIPAKKTMCPAPMQDVSPTRLWNRGARLSLQKPKQIDV